MYKAWKTRLHNSDADTKAMDQSCPWVGSTPVGLGWVESRFLSFPWFGLAWIDCAKSSIFLWGSY